MKQKKCNLHIEEIIKLLPHRFPFLFIDRIINFKKGKSLEAISNISFNTPIFQGHFPEYPIFPGVLIIEAMAQAACVLASKSTEDKMYSDKLYYLATINNARFKIPVRPGDLMVIKISFIQERLGIAKFTGLAEVDRKIVCKSEFMCTCKKKNN